jgi:hypothetical protein
VAWEETPALLVRAGNMAALARHLFKPDLSTAVAAVFIAKTHVNVSITKTAKDSHPSTLPSPGIWVYAGAFCCAPDPALWRSYSFVRFAGWVV